MHSSNTLWKRQTTFPVWSDLGFFSPPHLNSHRVWTGCPKGVGFFQNQIFSFEKVFSTQYGLMLHSSSGLNNRAREGRDQCGRVVPWLPDQEIPPVQHKCVPPPTHTPTHTTNTHIYTPHTHTHTHSTVHIRSWNILVERALWKRDVTFVFQRFCQISHKSLQHENWLTIKNYTYIIENNTHWK